MKEINFNHSGETTIHIYNLYPECYYSSHSSIGSTPNNQKTNDVVEPIVPAGIYDLEGIKSCGAFEGIVLACLALASAALLPAIRRAIFDSFDKRTVEHTLKKLAKEQGNKAWISSYLKKISETSLELKENAIDFVHPLVCKWEKAIYILGGIVFFISLGILIYGISKVCHLWVLGLLLPLLLTLFAYHHVRHKLKVFTIEKGRSIMSDLEKTNLQSEPISLATKVEQIFPHPPSSQKED